MEQELFKTPSVEQRSEMEDYTEFVTDKNVLDVDPIGLPDAKDIENIKAIFRNYEKAKPGEIGQFMAVAYKERQANSLAGNEFNKTAGTDKGMAAQRKVFTMPIGLYRQIEEAYPLMFKNRKHLRWFRTNFSHFNASEKF